MRMRLGDAESPKGSASRSRFASFAARRLLSRKNFGFMPKPANARLADQPP
jgi:hypothetical protein